MAADEEEGVVEGVAWGAAGGWASRPEVPSSETLSPYPTAQRRCRAPPHRVRLIYRASRMRYRTLPQVRY